MKPLALCALAFFLGGWASMQAAKSGQAPAAAPVRLGNFSVSLNVKDIAASRAFYEKLGFHPVFGSEAQHLLILQNEACTIGLFQGFFDRTSFTFNPGWSRDMQTLPDFDDVRDIQKLLKSRGVAIMNPADESTSGPASFSTADPDGNPILIDQHVPAPGKK